MFKFIKRARLKKDIAHALSTNETPIEKIRELEERSKLVGLDPNFYHTHQIRQLYKKKDELIEKIKSCYRYSYDDETNLTEIGQLLNYDYTLWYDAELFSKFRILWKYENEKEFTLKPVYASIILKKDEQCYLIAPTEWRQQATVRQRQGYSGVGVSFTVAKGVRLYTGRTAPSYTQHDELRLISKGTLHVTNQRLIMNGATKSTTIVYNKIIDLVRYQDGIEIIKATGKPDYFCMEPYNAQLAALAIKNFVKGQ